MGVFSGKVVSDVWIWKKLFATENTEFTEEDQE